MTDSMLAGLDIGTSKVTCVVAELDDDGELVISSVGEAATLRWLRFVLEDDLDAWAAAEQLIRDLVVTEPQLDAVLAATADAERLAFVTAGLTR